jgi:hypothetical protein
MRAGQMVRLLTEYPSQRMPLHLVYPSRRNLAPRTRVVMDFLFDQAREISAALAIGSELAPKSRDVSNLGEEQSR